MKVGAVPPPGAAGFIAFLPLQRSLRVISD